MSDSKTLDTIYTLPEAAERLRMNKNALARLARRTGHCSINGRNLLFSEADLLALWQEMRAAPSRRVERLLAEPAQRTDERLQFFLARRPATTVDQRVIGILQWLCTQRLPKTYAQIDRCGPQTVEELLRKNLVENRGQDKDGLIKIAVSPAGRDQVKKYERWLERRKKARGER